MADDDGGRRSPTLEEMGRLPSLRSAPTLFFAAKKNKYGMEPAFTRRLQTAAVNDYRANYRRFRKGAPEGTKGEGPDDGGEYGYRDDFTELTEGMETLLEDAFESGSTWASGKQMKIFEEVMDYRMTYRKFRRGNPWINKTDPFEVVRGMTMQQARLLPVAQLSALMNALPRQPSGIFHRQPLHLHIGAGRLGCGLIVPSMLGSGVPFAILQKPLAEWDPVTHGTTAKRLPIIINGQEVSKLTVVRGPDDVSRISAPDCPHLLVVTEDAKVLTALVTAATSFSTSLGPFMYSIVPMLKHLPVMTDKIRLPPLFGCENDHAMVDAMGQALQDRVELVHCMVDRICPDRTVHNDAIKVVTEPYSGELVIMHPHTSPAPIPFGGHGVRMPQLEAQANYFCRRKLLLVNGSHTTLAFITLVMNQPTSDDSNPGDWPLIDWGVDKCGEQYHREIWAWAVARLLIILWENEQKVIMGAHGVHSEEELCDVLLDHTTKTLQRFASIKDTTKRVLGGGVANRWEGRLKAVDKFLQNYCTTPLASILLQKAKLRLPYMKQVISRLCNDSFRFTGINLSTAPKHVVT